MDENKRQTLIKMNYRVHKCCGLCSFAKIKPGNDFGECTKYDYKHLKHTEAAKPLSVNIHGGCPDWKMNEPKVAVLHAFVHFLNP